MELSGFQKFFSTHASSIPEETARWKYFFKSHQDKTDLKNKVASIHEVLIRWLIGMGDTFGLLYLKPQPVVHYELLMIMQDYSYS